EDGFMDIEFKDSFKEEEIKIFMKVLKKIVEHGESKKNEYQNIKSTSFCSGLTHLNKYAFPYFSKVYSEWTIRKKTDERISRITKENNMLKRKLNVRDNDKEINSSDEGDTENNNDRLESRSKTVKNSAKKQIPTKHDLLRFRYPDLGNGTGLKAGDIYAIGEIIDE
ncbi:2002_t:CDS:2, partial [Racocetra persica]